MGRALLVPAYDMDRDADAPSGTASRLAQRLGSGRGLLGSGERSGCPGSACTTAATIGRSRISGLVSRSNSSRGNSVTVTRRWFSRSTAGSSRTTWSGRIGGSVWPSAKRQSCAAMAPLVVPQPGPNLRMHIKKSPATNGIATLPRIAGRDSSPRPRHYEGRTSRVSEAPSLSSSPTQAHQATPKSTEFGTAGGTSQTVPSAGAGTLPNFLSLQHRNASFEIRRWE